MAEKAAEAGILEAPAFFRYTPREISLLFSAARAHLERREEERWLLSRYVALAIHAPEHLPGPPVHGPVRDMTDEEMKQRLLAWRGKEN